MKEGWHDWKKTSKEEKNLFYFLIQVKRRLVLTRIQMNYTFILKTKHGTYTENSGDILFFYKENEEWKNNLENVLQIVWEFLI